jgi:hypothetical protein
VTVCGNYALTGSEPGKYSFAGINAMPVWLTIPLSAQIAEWLATWHLLRSLGNIGSSAREVEQLLHQMPPAAAATVAVSFITKRTVRASWAGSACRLGQDRRPVGWAQGHLSTAITARLMIEANNRRMHWKNGVGNEKLEIIGEKLDQIGQELESN